MVYIVVYRSLTGIGQPLQNPPGCSLCRRFCRCGAVWDGHRADATCWRASARWFRRRWWRRPMDGLAVCSVPSAEHGCGADPRSAFGRLRNEISAQIAQFEGVSVQDHKATVSAAHGGRITKRLTHLAMSSSSTFPQTGSGQGSTAGNSNPYPFITFFIVFDFVFETMMANRVGQRRSNHQNS